MVYTGISDLRLHMGVSKLVWQGGLIFLTRNITEHAIMAVLGSQLFSEMVKVRFYWSPVLAEELYIVQDLLCNSPLATRIRSHTRYYLDF